MRRNMTVIPKSAASLTTGSTCVRQAELGSVVSSRCLPGRSSPDLGRPLSTLIRASNSAPRPLMDVLRGLWDSHMRALLQVLDVFLQF